jgi:hypothetical protein
MPTPLHRLARAGVTLAVVDFCWALALSLASGQPWIRTWQGVASTLLGRGALDGGMRSTAIGLTMHVGVAFGWSAVFLLLWLRSAGLRRRIATRTGMLQVAAVCGPCIWMVMSLVVIPLLVQRPPTITGRWFIQLAGHFPFVGIPIVASIAAGGPGEDGGAS